MYSHITTSKETRLENQIVFLLKPNLLGSRKTVDVGTVKLLPLMFTTLGEVMVILTHRRAALRPPPLELD
jgi:hypothetical protein